MICVCGLSTEAFRENHKLGSGKKTMVLAAGDRGSAPGGSARYYCKVLSYEMFPVEICLLSKVDMALS